MDLVALSLSMSYFLGYTQPASIKTPHDPTIISVPRQNLFWCVHLPRTGPWNLLEDDSPMVQFSSQRNLSLC